MSFNYRRLAFWSGFLLCCAGLYGQDLPATRRTDWHHAGYPGMLPMYDRSVDITDFGGAGDGATPNDSALLAAVAGLEGKPGTVYFPEGVYVFKGRVRLRDSLVLKGAGADATELHFQLGGVIKDCIVAAGGLEPEQEAVFLTESVAIGDTLLQTPPGAHYSAGEWLKLGFDDSLVVYSAWARGLAGQIFQVEELLPDHTIRCNHPMRVDIPLAWRPRLLRVQPVAGAGVECLKIKRFDGNVPIGMNISFQYANGCWVLGVESETCNFAHLSLAGSVHCEVYGNYFHHAFAYGDGGQGYGVACEGTSGDNRIQNNVFRYLRHSVLLQSGANGNVVGYNFSTEPHWDNVPPDGCGELVIHGNYPSFNLFEGNIVNNIRPDGSHGLNGPNNTFLRNRTQGYGFITTGDQSFLNVLGNEIISNGPFQGLFLVGGTDNFLYNNNVQGSITPAGSTGIVADSYYLNELPRFLEGQQYLIGAPAAAGSGKLPAEIRFLQSPTPTDCAAREGLTVAQEEARARSETPLLAFPNPFNASLELRSNTEIPLLEVFDCLGGKMLQLRPAAAFVRLDTRAWPKGVYWIRADNAVRMVVKQ